MTNYINYKNKYFYFDEIVDKIRSGSVTDEEKEFIIEALGSCFYTEDGMTVVDENAVTIMSNSAHKKIMDVDSSMIVNKPVGQLVKEGMFNQSASSLVIKSRKQETILQNLPNGKTVLVTSTPVFARDGKKIDRIINNVRDVQKLYDEQLKQEALLNQYQTELQRRNYVGKAGVIAESEKMRNVIKFAERVASNNSTVLILGESGVGKGMIAQLIYEMGDRADKPLVSINCGAIPEHLLESELFGYEYGAFTGARKEGKIGLLEAADQGTIFLDEIGELPLSLQPKLLSFIETGKLMRVGSTKEIKVDCKIITATNRKLKKMVEEGTFREDLYYRLNVIPIEIPPLRERREDIIPLVLKFLKDINKKNGTNKVMSPELLEAIAKENWKGNVRELRNAIERMVVLSLSDTLEIEDVPNIDVEVSNVENIDNKDLPVDLTSIVHDLEDKYIEKAMKEGGSIRKAAKLLGVSPTALFRRINRNE